MDGLQAIERLRETREFRKTPIIALTALAMPSDYERCVEAGADDYLGKPIGLKELHQRIQTWIQRLMHSSKPDSFRLPQFSEGSRAVTCSYNLSPSGSVHLFRTWCRMGPNAAGMTLALRENTTRD